MTDILTSRDGLIGNSPRYTGAISPPYQRYLKDDAGNAINLTGVSPSALSIVFVNQSNPLTVKSGSGTFSIPSGTANQGLASYQYSAADLATSGNWYAFWTVQITGEPGPRAFDPDFLSIIASPTAGGSPSVTIQDVNLTEVNGTAVSSSNPVPTSGPVTAVDGGIATLGNTTDTSSANTTIGLLKAIKAYLGGTLTASVSSLPALPAGSNVIGHVIVDSAGAVTVTALPSIPAGTNVIGHVIVDSAGSVSVTSLPSLPAGSNTIGGVKLIDSAGTNVAGVDSSNNQLVKVNAALPAGTNVIGHVIVDSAGSVSVTNLPALPAGTNVIGHVIVDSGTITANAGTNLNTSLLALESGGNLAGIKADADSLVTNTTGLATQSTLSAAKTDLDTIATQTATPNVSDRWARQVGQVDVARVLGSALSQSNPVITEVNIQNWTRNGQGFYATTGNPVTATNTNVVVCDMSLFNASNSGKNVLIFSISVGANASAMGSNGLYVTTSDPSGGTGFTGTPISGNLKLGGSGPSASLSMSATGITTSVTKAGTYAQAFPVNGNVITELLTNGATILLPNGSANGIAVYHSVATAGQAYNCTVRWIEY